MDIKAKINILSFIAYLVFFASGCSAARLTGQVLNTAGKIVVTTGKVACVAIKTTGKVVVATTKMITTIVQMPAGRQTIKLSKRGNTLLVNALLNQKVQSVLILDTGCADSQISGGLAQRLGITSNQGDPVQCVLAGGNIITARAVTINQVRLGAVRAYNIRAIVLDQDKTFGSDGLLGMSFFNNFIFKIDSVKQELILEKRK